MNIKELFTVAYAYELATGDVDSFSSGSHEIMLGIKFCKDKPKEIEQEVAPEPVVEIAIEEIEELKKEEGVIVDPDPIPEPVIVPEEKIKAPKDFDRNVFDLKVKFPLNDNQFSDSFEASLDKIVKVIVENPDLKVEVIGYSCDLGSDKTEGNISKNRAIVVKAYLVQKGVNTNNISTKGMSDSQQVVPNISEINREQNSIVEFVIKK